jgi:hypothetical protein
MIALTSRVLQNSDNILRLQVRIILQHLFP